ncbi:MAG: prephenate dehydrogenase/arogenate dehydrogenase family protein [Actinobacteria bacterium]|nr:prephenate dehydrogenase/arogenate dehydrogenase family protein [Actinomycetota bacterium]
MASHVGIIGTGLIGASIGLALGQAGWTRTGWDADPEALATARVCGAIDVAVSGPQAVLDAEPDVVILAAPPSAIRSLLEDLETDVLVMDVASVKSPILESSTLAHFVGTHPMAGREVSGPDAATAALFRGAAWVVTTDGASPDDLAAVTAVIEAVGARVLLMSAAEHDRAVGVVSHLPHLIASTLMDLVSNDSRSLELAAGSFRDLTRVAGSSPDFWKEVLVANADVIAESVTAFRVRLDEMLSVIESGDVDAIADRLSQAQAARRDLGAPIGAIRVALADRPGELARVGQAFQRSSADIRDIQMRHAPYGGGGILTVSVNVDDVEVMVDALTTEGLYIIE